jgi:hypothetical protein
MFAPVLSVSKSVVFGNGRFDHATYRYKLRKQTTSRANAMFLLTHNVCGKTTKIWTSQILYKIRECIVNGVYIKHKNKKV